MAKVDLGQVVGATGPKGDTGATGNGISNITTTQSSADGGNNTVTISMTDGTSKSFNVKNGTKGSKGDTGATGSKGDNGITPTFSIENGHLFADYDTPYSG